MGEGLGFQGFDVQDNTFQTSSKGVLRIDITPILPQLPAQFHLP